MRNLLTFAFSLFAGSLAVAQMAELKADPLALAPGGEFWGSLPFYNTTVVLSLDRPASVVREPPYSGTPLYGSIRVGNASRSAFTLVVDHPTSGDWNRCRLYVDVNQDGDLGNDGDGTWGGQPFVRGDAARLGPKIVMLRGSYGDGRSEIELRSQPYEFLFFYTKPSPDSGMQLSYRRATARVGSLSLDGTDHRVMMVENDNDGVFRLNKGDAGRPLWLFIDADGDGRFGGEERHDIRQPIQVLAKNYVVRPAADGSRVMLTPFQGEVPGRATAAVAGGPRPARIPLLAAGTQAPEFTAIKPDGSELHLAEYRGRVVVLDFWATWCGPCMRAMPHLQQIWASTREQGVEAVGICVWDERAAFDAWMADPKVKTTFQKAFDPAGVNRDNANADSIAKRLYNVSGIPTMYVIDREGKIVDGILGFSGAGDHRLADALKKAGIRVAN